MPGNSGVPIMVCVLPDEVWPYAKMVPASMVDEINVWHFIVAIVERERERLWVVVGMMLVVLAVVLVLVLVWVVFVVLVVTVFVVLVVVVERIVVEVVEGVDVVEVEVMEMVMMKEWR